MLKPPRRRNDQRPVPPYEARKSLFSALTEKQPDPEDDGASANNGEVASTVERKIVTLSPSSVSAPDPRQPCPPATPSWYTTMTHQPSRPWYLDVKQFRERETSDYHVTNDQSIRSLPMLPAQVSQSSEHRAANSSTKGRANDRNKDGTKTNYMVWRDEKEQTRHELRTQRALREKNREHKIMSVVRPDNPHHCHLQQHQYHRVPGSASANGQTGFLTLEAFTPLEDGHLLVSSANSNNTENQGSAFAQTVGESTNHPGESPFSVKAQEAIATDKFDPKALRKAAKAYSQDDVDNMRLVHAPNRPQGPKFDIQKFAYSTTHAHWFDVNHGSSRADDLPPPPQPHITTPAYSPDVIRDLNALTQIAVKQKPTSFRHARRKLKDGDMPVDRLNANTGSKKIPQNHPARRRPTTYAAPEAVNKADQRADARVKVTPALPKDLRNFLESGSYENGGSDSTNPTSVSDRKTSSAAREATTGSKTASFSSEPSLLSKYRATTTHISGSGFARSPAEQDTIHHLTKTSTTVASTANISAAVSSASGGAGSTFESNDDLPYANGMTITVDESENNGEPPAKVKKEIVQLMQKVSQIYTAIQHLVPCVLRVTILKKKTSL